MQRKSRFIAALGGCAALAMGAASQVRADGTETLGEPSIDLATGAGFVAAGTGLVAQPGTIEFDVPAGETIQQVLLYWSGEYRTTDDDAVEVNGVEVAGELIGGPTYFYTFDGDVYVSAYRADITDLDLVAPGSNALEVTGLDYDHDNAGAGVIVIYGDCGDAPKGDCPLKKRNRWHRCNRFCRAAGRSTRTATDCADVQIVDGADIAFFQFPDPRRATVPQTFSFESARVDRVADLAIFTGSVEAERPNQIWITVDGQRSEIIDLLGDSAGPSWDAPTIPVDIPAGASSLTVEVVSTQSSDPLGASVVWVTSALAVPDAPKDIRDRKCRRTRYQKSNWCSRMRAGKGWCRQRR